MVGLSAVLAAGLANGEKLVKRNLMSSSWSLGGDFVVVGGSGIVGEGGLEGQAIHGMVEIGCLDSGWMGQVGFGSGWFAGLAGEDGSLGRPYQFGWYRLLRDDGDEILAPRGVSTKKGRAHREGLPDLGRKLFS